MRREMIQRVKPFQYVSLNVNDRLRRCRVESTLSLKPEHTIRGRSHATKNRNAGHQTVQIRTL